MLLLTIYLGRESKAKRHLGREFQARTRRHLDGESKKNGHRIDAPEKSSMQVKTKIQTNEFMGRFQKRHYFGTAKLGTKSHVFPKTNY